MPNLKPNSPTFQELILRLQNFWAERGCVLQQPYDVEVGAGTMAPETFLRVLGPQPYKVAYVQPSRRPADGRYGENPNRLYKHMQLQVILKPPPENAQNPHPVSPKNGETRVGQPALKEKKRFPLLGAYELCLKCSHLFNILDARGAISVTERVGVIARVRALAVGIAKAWVDQQKSEVESAKEEPEPAAENAAE